jgi:hypothetical protein
MGQKSAQHNNRIIDDIREFLYCILSHSMHLSHAYISKTIYNITNIINRKYYNKYFEVRAFKEITSKIQSTNLM